MSKQGLLLPLRLDVRVHSGKPSEDRSYKENYVPPNNVVALHPDTYVAMIDVSIELPLVTASVWLNFGPFDSEIDAMEWTNILEVVHVQIANDDTHHLYASGNSTFSSEEESFPRSFIGTTDIKKVNASFRAPGELIPSGSPTDTAGELCTYALEALAEAITQTLSVLP